MANTIGIKDFVDAAAKASDRSRQVFLTLVLASAIVLIWQWNVKYSNWMAELIQGLRCDLHTVEQVGNRPAECADISAGAVQKGLDASEIRKILESYQQEYLRDFQIISIPVLGISVHYNSISVLGGAILSYLLFWLRYSLARELQNVIMLRQQTAQSEEGGTAFALLSMHQVLTVPPSGTRILRISFSNWLLALPFIAQGATMANFVISYLKGAALSSSLTLRNFIAGWAFFAIVALLSLSCQLLRARLEKVWSHWAAGVSRRNNSRAMNAHPEPHDVAPVPDVR